MFVWFAFYFKRVARSGESINPSMDTGLDTTRRINRLGTLDTRIKPYYGMIASSSLLSYQLLRY